MTRVKDEDEQALVVAAERFSRDLASEERAALLQFFRLLLVWNARVNLTGARTVAVLAQEHLTDALALSKLAPPGARLLDVGSGAGLPAIPFAVLRPDADVTLVEPRAKRVAFLRTALRELALTARLHAGRLETLELPSPAFDLACSRATFKPAQWWELGRRLVRPGGRVVLFLSGRATELPTALPEAAERVSYLAGGSKPRMAVAVPVPRETS